MSTAGEEPRSGADGRAEDREDASVQTELAVSLVLSAEWRVPLSVRLHYRTNDPYAVHLDFHPHTQEPVYWVFARELLTSGLRSPTGRADVRVWQTDHRTVSLALGSAVGEALLEIPFGVLSAWLEDTYRLVPPGGEEQFLGMDALLERLLAGGPGNPAHGGSGGSGNQPYEQPHERQSGPAQRGEDGGPENGAHSSE